MNLTAIDKFIENDTCVQLGTHMSKMISTFTEFTCILLTGELRFFRSHCQLTSFQLAYFYPLIYEFFEPK